MGTLFRKWRIALKSYVQVLISGTKTLERKENDN